MKTLSVASVSGASVRCKPRTASAQEPKLPDNVPLAGISHVSAAACRFRHNTTSHLSTNLVYEPSNQLSRPLVLVRLIHNQSKGFSGPAAYPTIDRTGGPTEPLSVPATGIIRLHPKSA